jgi:hypothetical protein
MGGGGARIVAPRADAYPAVGNRLHGKLHRISGCIAGNLRAVPEFVAQVIRVEGMDTVGPHGWPALVQYA